MSGDYIVTLKSGVTCRVTAPDKTKNLTGLWIFLSKKIAPEFISFVEATILVSEIAMIEVVEDHLLAFPEGTEDPGDPGDPENTEGG